MESDNTKSTNKHVVLTFKSWMDKVRTWIIHILGGTSSSVSIKVQNMEGLIEFGDIQAFVNGCFDISNEVSEVIFCSSESENGALFQQLLQIENGMGKVALIVAAICANKISQLYCILGDGFDANLENILLQNNYSVRITK